MGLQRPDSDTEAMSDCSDVCTSSSVIGSPLWPQSFGRTMDIYSRSTSQRSEGDLGLEGISNAFESISSPAAARLRDNESTVPLLEKLGHHQPDNTGSEDTGQGSTFFQALFNGMNVLAGVGILSTPYAAAKGGWLGLILLLAFALICCYTAILLRRCLDSDPCIRSYPDVGEASFGKWGRWIISIMLYLELYAVAIEFLILEGDNLAQLFPSAGITIGSVVLNPHEVFVILSAVCMLPTVWLRELSVLSYISAFGVIASFLIVLSVGWIGLLDGVGFHQQGSLLHLDGLPVAVGLYSFCYCGHAVFPSIYGSMRDRTQFSHVLVICFILCTLMYGGIAVMGYSMFGDDLQSQITLNLPQEAPASHFAIWVTLVNPFAKYAITLTPVAVALEEFLPHSMASSSKDMRFWGTILRTLIVISTVIVALTVPFFGLLMAFIGSFLSASVSIILPCLCYLKIYRQQLPFQEASLVGVLLFFGILVGVGGTFYSLKAIIDNFLGLERVGLFQGY
ncbi:hypothetical protein KC19_4G260800 [Ceratodon purpureus]|uniref:Amino acid transporter transmembrane domain-containing protein n=1 Tax=Ceratodon purpureus TaxID=3225 RepID=A0A8T0IGE2_CERPU|nr:hypothetical protein KC19_4G260800 [Ceratodon purpureus]